MRRFRFLDWTRGLAVVLMIQCHTFNSFVRVDARESGAYMLSQYVGGMAAPLFLFMAGMTLAFLMDKLDGREPTARRWWISLRRGAYVLGVAYAFRLTMGLPKQDWQEIMKVDILNAMGLAMIVFSVAALFSGRSRSRFAAALGLAIAAVSPVVAYIDSSQAPALMREYIVPGPGGGRFAFFPYASYVGFGLAAGSILKHTREERLERLMQWAVLAGLGLVIGAQYFSSLPFSIYPNSDFWTNSPALIFIRVGIALWLLAGAYLWTEYGAGPRWSWMQCLGKCSLMVYLTHVVLVYGNTTKWLHGTLDILGAMVATMLVLGLMVAGSAAWLAWKARRAVFVGQAGWPVHARSAPSERGQATRPVLQSRD